MKNVSYYKNAAWQQLSGKRCVAALLFTLVYFVLGFATSKIDDVLMGPLYEKYGVFVPPLVMILLFAPIQYSYNVAFLNDARTGEGINIGSLFEGYKKYERVMGTYLLEYLYVSLWALLFVVPGIIKSISYSQIYYILNDNPMLAYDRAIERSMTMMEGHKWEYFCLCISFIGWFLLGILTIGIGFLWITPYVSKTLALFYEDLKAEYENNTINNING